MADGACSLASRACSWGKTYPLVFYKYGGSLVDFIIQFQSKILMEKRREREREFWPRDRPEKGRSWWFCISGKENGLGERRPCVMNTQGVEKGLEKDSKAVVQSDRVSGVTTDSSAMTIGQSEPV